MSINADTMLEWNKDHPELVAFAMQMTLKLQKNRRKLQKPKLPPEALLKKLRIEVEELSVALEHETLQEAMEECVDVANFAMLIWKRLYLKGDIDGAREDALKPSPIIRTEQKEPEKVSGYPPVLNPSDFVRQGWWNPTSDEFISMFMHKPTNVVYYGRAPRTVEMGLPTLEQDFCQRIS